MKTKSLYNKYRPLKYSEVIGQNLIIKLLKNSLMNDLVNHSYLFHGTRGTGKTTVARIFAKSLNCSNLNKENMDPCDKCDSCKAINNGASLDVIEIDAASNNGVDEIRQLKEKTNYMLGSNYKIFIIDEVHMLSKAAFNAFLKILEEPPKNVVFILITTEIFKIPETILSRTLILDFLSPSKETIIGNLKVILEQEKVEYELESLNYIALLSKGSIRDSVSILEKIMILDNKKIMNATVQEIYGLMPQEQLIDILLEENIKEFIIFIEKNKNNIKHFVYYYIQTVTDLLVQNQIKNSNKFILIVNQILNFLFVTNDPFFIYSKIISITNSVQFIDNDLISKDEKNLKIKVENKIQPKKIEIEEKLQPKKIEIKQEISIKKNEVPKEINNFVDETEKYIFSAIKQKYFLEKKYEEAINKYHIFNILKNSKEDLNLSDLYKQQFATNFVYETSNKWKKYVKLFEYAKFEYGIKSAILISFKNEEKYNEFKEVAFENELLDFSKELFQINVIIVATLKNQLPTIEKILIKEIKENLNSIDEINFENLYKKNNSIKKENLEKLSNFFGKKMNIIE